MKGERVERMKDRDGNRLTDAHLARKLGETVSSVPAVGCARPVNASVGTASERWTVKLAIGRSPGTPRRDPSSLLSKSVSVTRPDA